MKVCVALMFIFNSLLIASAEEKIHDGLVKINAEEVKAAQTLVSLSVIPSIEALHEWVPKAFENTDDMTDFQQQLITPKVVFRKSLGILKKVETFLRNDTDLYVNDIRSLRDDLKILASAQFYCLEMYSVFSDPKLPMSKEERETLTQSIKKASKVYLGVSDLLLNYYSVSDGKVSSVQDKTPAPPEHERASIPYQNATLLSWVFNDSKTNSFVNVQIQSRLKGVNPSDIEPFIDSKEGKIQLNVDANGFCRIPLTDALIKENPKIISSQPRGSLTLEAGSSFNDQFSIAVDNNRIRYNELMQPVQLLNNKLLDLEKSSFIKSGSLPMIALLIQYPEIDLPDSIVIEMKSGDVSIPVTSGKCCILEDRKSIRDENPWVKLPPYSFKATAYKTSKPENWEDQ